MPTDILRYLGKTLRAARKKAKLTQEGLSEKVGISTRHIAKIEKGVMNPSYEILYYLINELDISADKLFNTNMTEDNERLSNLLHYYNSCEPTEQEIILNVVECLSKSFKK